VLHDQYEDTKECAMPRVAVIVNIFNSERIVAQCLDALFTKSSSDVSFILIDNHGPDQETRKMIGPNLVADWDSEKYAHLEHAPYVPGTEMNCGEIKHIVQMGAHKRSGVIQPTICTVFDPGRNLGAHNGWNFGFEHGVVDKGFDYVVKLDDDTVIQTQDFDRLMVRGLHNKPGIAFLSADGSLYAKQLDTWDVQIAGDPQLPGDALVYEIPPRNIVDFHCVMFRVAEMMKWERKRQTVSIQDIAGASIQKVPWPANMYSGRVWLTNPEGDGDKRLYGGEELYMAQKVRAEGRQIAYFRNVFCEHLDAKDRCQDYQLWKWCYGLCRWTEKGLVEWRESGEMLRDLRRMVGLWGCPECNPVLAEWVKQYIVESVQRIGDLGDGSDAKKLLMVAHGVPSLGIKPRSDMPEVIKALEEAAAKLQDKYK
jgi:glycosyltransferase involved in cell wall biosynthesis